MSTTVTLTVDNQGTVLVSWAALAQAETGQVAEVGSYPGPKTIQIRGTFGPASIAIQGSNDNSNWDTMSIFDLQTGAYVLLTGIVAAQFAQLIENPKFLRAVVTGGDGTTALSAVISIPSLR